jgi:hypothetical protein
MTVAKIALALSSRSVDHALVGLCLLDLNRSRITRRLIQQIEQVLILVFPQFFSSLLVEQLNQLVYRNPYINSWTNPELKISPDKKICPSVVK